MRWQRTGRVDLHFSISIYRAEREILKKKEVREQDRGLSAASSREELQRNIVARMKAVTNASDDVCVSLLESNSYDLKVSVEAYLSS